MRRLSHVHATVHRQHSARNISGGGTCEEAGGIRDIIRLTQSAKRNLSGHGGAVLFGEVLRHIGIDEPRGDAVRRHAAAAKLAGDGAREADQAGLRGGGGKPR